MDSARLRLEAMTDLVANRERLTRTFLELAQIDSPALHEGAMANVVQTELHRLGWEVIDDRTGPQVGNLFARRTESSGPAKHVLFATHLDVVEPCRGVQPRLRDGVIESNGTTVLGADAKA